MTGFPLLAPFAAWVGPLGEVPDPAFSEGLMGEGLALDPTEGVVRAPCDAEVIAVAPTMHSVTLRHATGCEILIHVGIDTVELRGAGFEALVTPGNVVIAGTPLLRFDLGFVAHHARSLITPILLLNDGLHLESASQGKLVQAGEVIGEVAGLAQKDRDAPLANDAGAFARHKLNVPLPNGLHARPSARIAARLKSLDADVYISLGSGKANARSITSLLKLNVRHGDEIEILAIGPEADAAANALKSLILFEIHEEPVADSSRDDAGNGAAAEPASEPGGSKTIPGRRAAPGGALGTAVQLAVEDRAIPSSHGSAEEELGRLTMAIGALTLKLESQSGHSDIAGAHLVLLSDPDLLAEVRERIAAGQGAAAAWREVTRGETVSLQASGNALLAERAADLVDVERQLIDILLGAEADTIELPAGAILIADELFPSQFMDLDLSRLAGIVSAAGGPTSHVALLAASNGIPMLVSCGPAVFDIAAGTPLLISPDRALLHIDPDPALSQDLQAQIARKREEEQANISAAAADCWTLDGKRIEVFANCGSAEDAALAARNGAEGSGLVRTEFLFLGRQNAPTQAEQVEAYAKIAAALPGRPVIYRTLDAGSDKPLPYLDVPAEENPALGLRGIRLCLSRPELLEDQFLAILQAVPDDQRRIMLPMVVELEELKSAKAILRKAEASLGISTQTPIGVMVETPAAALLAEQLAREADFLSVGSNDLTQYALAADRQNPAVSGYSDALHPAVLRLISQAADGAHTHGRWVGVCGGIASDPDAAALLIGLGVDELSVTPLMVPAVKARIRRLELADCRRLAHAALAESSAQAVRRLIEE